MGRGGGAWRGSSARQSFLIAALLVIGLMAVLALAAKLAHASVTDAAMSSLSGLVLLIIGALSFRDSRRDEVNAVTHELRKAHLAALAEVVIKELRNERAAQSHGRPVFPVRWVAAPPELVVRWSAMLDQASAARGGWEPPPGGWLASEHELAGQGGELIGRLARVPAGRLLILGEPGSGKTFLAMRLVLDLLEQRAADLLTEAGQWERRPVPVLVPIASWEPARQELFDWLADQLAAAYPEVARGSRASVALIYRDLLNCDLIIPVFDGLDEMDPVAQAAAITEIGEIMATSAQPMMVTCRRDEFLAAITNEDGIPVALEGAVGIELRRLDLETAAEFLHPTSAVRDPRWEKALNGLPSGNPLLRVLSVPLWLSLARAIYNPRREPVGGKRRTPEELRGLADETRIKEKLLAGFISTVYREGRGARTDPARAEKAEKWLGYLAHHLESRVGSPNFTWWQLAESVPRRVSWVLTGLITGLTTVLAIALQLAVFLIAGGLTGVHSRNDRSGLACVSGAVEGTLTAFAVVFLVTAGLAFTLTPPPGGRPDIAGWWRAALLTAGPLAVGALVTWTAWHYETKHRWWAIVLGAGAALVIALTVCRLHWSEDRNEDLLRAAGTGVLLFLMAGLTFGVTYWAVTGEFVNAGVSWFRTWSIITGLCAFFGAARRPADPAQGGRRKRRRRQGARWWVPSDVTIGAVLAGVAAVVVSLEMHRPLFGKPVGAVLGIEFAVAGGLSYGLARIQAGKDGIAGPSKQLARARRGTLRLGLVIGLAAGLLAGTVVPTWIASDTSGDPFLDGPQDWTLLVTGLAAALAVFVIAGVGFAVTGLNGDWPRWLMARYWLALRGDLPGRLVPYLADAHRRGVLRQYGPYYQFRHIEVQIYLNRTFKTR
jgi:hypothetical protein